MVRTSFTLVFATLALGWVLASSPALADETVVVYEDKAVAAPAAQEEPREAVAPSETRVETSLAHTGCSLGLQGGYGITLWGSRHLDLAEIQPSVAFPITNAVGSSFYRGVLEYRIEPFVGFIRSRDDKLEAGLAPIGLRYDFTGLGGRVVPFFEGQLGVVYLNVPREVQGTKFNFVTAAGTGIRYFVSDRVALALSARIRHTSNAGIREPNGGFNTGFLLFGLDYY